MNNYWLSRRGGAAEGPFTALEIAAMWQHGQFADTDLLCMEGTEDWQPASKVLLAPQPEEPLPPPLEPPRLPQEKNFPAARKVSRSENLSVPIIIGLAGFAVCIWTRTPWGLLLIGIALFVDKRIWVCGNCQSMVEKEADFCRQCGSTLYRRVPYHLRTSKPRPFFERPLGMALIFLVLLAALGAGVWYMATHRPH